MKNWIKAKVYWREYNRKFILLDSLLNLAIAERFQSGKNTDRIEITYNIHV